MAVRLRTFGGLQRPEAEMRGLRLLPIAAALTASIGGAPAADALAFMRDSWPISSLPSPFSASR